MGKAHPSNSVLRRAILLPGLLLVAEWLLAAASILSVALVVVVPAALCWSLFRRRFYTLTALVLGCPLTLPFVAGIVGWCRGDGVMMGVGLQRYHSASIDPFTRLLRATSGCVVSGNEWVEQAPYNAGIRAMTLLFGPPANAYDGPIPTAQEARAALVGAHVVDWQDLARDTLPFDGAAPVRLGHRVGAALIYSCYSFDVLHPDETDSAPPPGAIRATLWKERVLLIELGSELDGLGLYDEEGNTQRRSQIAVLDVQRGLPFRYLGGSIKSCDRLPLLWRPVGPRALDMDLVSPLFPAL